MRKQVIQDAAFEVATQVRAVEDTIDSAFVEIAELQMRIMHANSIAAIGPAAVHPVLEQLATAMNGLVASRGAIIGCHAALAEAKGKVPGLRTVAIGDEECPPKPTGFAELRAVA